MPSHLYPRMSTNATLSPTIMTPTPYIPKNTTNMTLITNSTANITTYLRISMSNQNISNDEIVSNIRTLFSYLLPILIIAFIVVHIYIDYKNYNKNYNKTNMYNWLKMKYNSLTKNDILPTTRIKKAKESPFIGPSFGPPCPILDTRASNMVFQFSMPYRRMNSNENLNSNDEHRLTITTLVEQINTH